MSTQTSPGGPQPVQFFTFLGRIWRWLEYVLEEFIPVITLAVTVLAMIIQVFFRYVLDAPLTWPFELSIYAFVWTLYLGAAHATRVERHVRLDVIYNALPLKVRKSFDVIFNLVVCIIFAVALPSVWDYLLFSYRIRTVALKLPWTYVFAVFPIFLLLVIIHNAVHIVRDLRIIFGKSDS